MGFLKRIFQRGSEEPAQRVHICLQCGMPVGEHKDWCAIVKAQQGSEEGASTSLSGD